MNRPMGMWSRFRDEVRSVSDRTRRSARRAYDEGVLRVDLVSLRRERRRGLADLGERTLSMWNKGEFSSLESDPEMIRLRARAEGVDAAIAAKEVELSHLRAATEKAPHAPDPEAPTPES